MINLANAADKNEDNDRDRSQVAEDRTRKDGSQRKSVERKAAEDKDTSVNGSNSSMKIHKGPLNLSTVSMRNPIELMKSLLSVIEELGVKTTITSKYSVKCEKAGIKFTSEINMIENLENLFTIKFYKSSGDSLKYASLCNAIFTKIVL